ncbi:ATP-binding protein [Frankia sp. AgB32]|uniref:ATP-binding protein n=1 Tax=Frankia sp. AgB32 TaxID=631119 RepID=UPI002010B4F2|nr:ATP-binding protein [Frankia sp. AgB32]MCK9894208.1 histidine kinase [Frankia sp. AgB32]
MWLAVGLGVPLAVAALTFKVDQHYHPLADTAANCIGGLLFLVAGVVAHTRRPENPVALLVVLAGIGLFFEDLQLSTTPWVHTTGLLFARASSGFLAHLVLAFPYGRLASQTEGWLVGAAYGGVFVLAPIRALFTNNERLAIPRRNLLLLADSERLSGLLDRAVGILSAVVAAGVLVVLVRRWMSAGRPLRRVLAPVFLAGLLGGAATSVGGLLGPGQPWRSTLLWVYWLAFCMLPLGFLAGVLRVRLGRSAVGSLLVRLREPVSAAGLRAELARALGDPALQVGYWHSEAETFVDGEGRPLELPAVTSDRCVRLVERGGHRVAALLHDPALREDAHLLDAVTAAAGLALENQRLAAEVHARLAEVRASRGRIVAAADAARRQLERDLHDGAQQSLVAVAVGLRRARQRLDSTGDARSADLLADCATGLDAAIGELRELARGIHPAILTDAGLVPAIRGLAERSPLDVHLCTSDLPSPDPAGLVTMKKITRPEVRPGPAVEVTAYFVVAEALANAVKHARATHVWITVGCHDSVLRVQVTDDGVGGADDKAGTGLLGLRDRVSALDGALTVRSEPGAGTSLTAIIPLQQATTPREGPVEREAGYAT